MLKDLVIKNRSFRRFVQSAPVNRKTLMELLETARFAPTASNRQPLRFILSNEPEKNAKIFSTLAWARLIKGWGGPAEGERPSAYIVIVGDKQVTENFGVDHGIAADTILLAATGKALGGCMLANIKKDELRKSLAIPERFEILLVCAIGKPKEKVVLDSVGPDGDTAYWREDNGTHHVPKWKLEDLILE